MDSIWSGVAFPSFPSVEKDMKTDVLIIGGGICGLLCAYKLHRCGVNYILVEADEICQKTTMNTTAKISSLHGMIYKKLLSDVGAKNAYLYYEANQNAISELSELCSNIDCDFEKTSACIFTLDNEKRMRAEFDAIRKIGIDAQLSYRINIPFDAKCGIRFDNQAQFNPLKFASEICRDLNVFEHSRVSEMVDNTAIVNGHKIKAGAVIVATHFPFINKHGSYFLKMYQHRSYAIALKTNTKIDGMYINDTKFGLSLRSYGDTVILGGYGHRTGKNSRAWDGLIELADKYFPGNTVLNKWATQDCITLDGMPYIGQYSKSTPNLYVATGFNKWGMTSSAVASSILCDLVQGKENKYEKLFSPSRSILKPHLIRNAFSSTIGLLTPTVPRCPHLGCALKWNKQEHSWDCPCHGSRFDEDRHLLDGPANCDKK